MHKVNNSKATNAKPCDTSAVFLVKPEAISVLMQLKSCKVFPHFSWHSCFDSQSFLQVNLFSKQKDSSYFMVGVKTGSSRHLTLIVGNHCSVCQPNDPLRLFKLKSLCLRQPHWKTYGLLFNLLLSFLLLYIVEHTSLNITMLWLFNTESQYIDHLDRQLIVPSGAKCQTWGKLSIIWTPVYCPNWNTSLHLLVSACQCSSFRLNYKSLKKRCHSCIFRPAPCLWLTVCLVILVGWKKSPSHHFWVVLYQLIVPGPSFCSAVDQSFLFLIFCFLCSCLALTLSKPKLT